MVKLLQLEELFNLLWYVPNKIVFKLLLLDLGLSSVRVLVRVIVYNVYKHPLALIESLDCILNQQSRVVLFVDLSYLDDNN